jgi:hypothetical protein
MIVHHQPLGSGSVWNLHAWQLAWNGNSVWDPRGVSNAGLVEFQFPAVPEPRALQFKYRATSVTSGVSTWEPDDFIRQVVNITVTDVWTFAQSARILSQPSSPPGVVFEAGDVLTFKVITKQQFAGGRFTPGILMTRRTRRRFSPSQRAMPPRAYPHLPSRSPVG